MGVLFFWIFIFLIYLARSDSDSLYLDRAAVQEAENCKFANVIGECREIRKCPPFMYLLIRSKSRPSQRVLKLLRESHCGFKGKEPVVCCPKTYPTRVSNPQYTAVEPVKLVNSDEDSLMPSSCGAIAIGDKIFGGNDAKLYDFPWMALLGYETPQGFEYRCGGTVINRRYILTAAHCVTNLKSATLKSVRLGEFNLSSEVDCSVEEGCAEPARDYPIKKIISHPGFHDKVYRNDIALIELDYPVNFTKSVQPICLPVEKSQRRRSLEGQAAVISGWGATERGTYSSVLRTTEIRIVSQKECFESYNGIIPIFPSEICAGGDGRKDSCNGDSGGPLTVIDENAKNDQVYIQYGIVSFGSRNCSTRGKPGVYTRVTAFMDWIMDVMV